MTDKQDEQKTIRQDKSPKKGGGGAGQIREA